MRGFQEHAWEMEQRNRLRLKERSAEIEALKQQIGKYMKQEVEVSQGRCRNGARGTFQGKWGHRKKWKK